MRKKNWSNIVRNILKKKLISQIELAHICNVTPQTVSSWNTGVRIPHQSTQRILLDLYSESNVETLNKLDNDSSDLSFLMSNQISLDHLMTQFDLLGKKAQSEIIDAIKCKTEESRLLEYGRVIMEKFNILQDLLENINDAVWCIDYNGNYKQVYISPVFKLISGISPEEFSFNTKKWEQMVLKDDRDSYRNFHLNVVENKLNEAVFDYYIKRRPDEKVVKIRDKRKVIKLPNKTLRIVGVMSILH